MGGELLPIRELARRVYECEPSRNDITSIKNFLALRPYLKPVLKFSKLRRGCGHLIDKAINHYEWDDFKREWDSGDIDYSRFSEAGAQPESEKYGAHFNDSVEAGERRYTRSRICTDSVRMFMSLTVVRKAGA